MKKYISLLLLASLLLGMNACSTVTISGLENFSPADCSFELSRDLFPDETFLSKFEYSGGDYRLESHDGLTGSDSSAFAYLTYPPEVYASAKQYCLDQLDLCGDHRFSYAGFEFQERLSHFAEGCAGQFAVGCCYPEWFNMFGYCDDTCTLTFLGYYNTDPEENALAETDFAAFIAHEYSGCAPFDGA